MVSKLTSESGKSMASSLTIFRSFSMSFKVSLEASKMLKNAEVSYPRNEVLIFFKALEHFEKREYQKAVKIFYFLQENDKIDRDKIELLKQKLSQLKIIP